ncbi:MAG: hypothetical protein NBV60_06025 [Erythrobacter sp.]|nr:hypothetical protein [Erythrobacter sp.]
MSATDQDNGDPIMPGSPLARALDDFAVPGLPAGFADRVLAAAEARPAPLPELRRKGTGGARGWQLGRRIAIATVGFSALATAAAATGLLERFDLPVPSPEKVWASLTGKEAAAQVVASSVPASAPAMDPAPAAFAPVRIEGPVDTPEELGEAFRRIDEVRQGRSAMRRQAIEQRIEREKERRRAAGLPLPTPEQEARIRTRIESAEARREGVIDQRLEQRRAEMRERVEAGEALTREDIVRPLREEQRSFQQREKFERLRQMNPEQRREALRRLPPAERRALMEAWQQRRAQRLGNDTPAGAEPPAALDAAPDAAPQPDLSQTGTPKGEPPR